MASILVASPFSAKPLHARSMEYMAADWTTGTGCSSNSSETAYTVMYKGLSLLVPIYILILLPCCGMSWCACLLLFIWK